ncbi:hypothetical protein Sango_1167800 [Sesamum angolense]|uniref:Uncharacterized protein n=1 Tax=Sesamum angolense TaxID=2727404 RepID=A0AAE1WWX4_9LAMI|nr:hypothetical protein Sango_1167800 [Sesamum angolense]
MAATVCELKWITFLLCVLNIVVDLPIPLQCDNQTALHIMANPVVYGRTKHLDIDWHLVRDHFESDFINPLYFRNTDQLVDLFTKILPSSVFTTFWSKLGLFAVASSPT